jgi:hypothetical protein
MNETQKFYHLSTLVTGFEELPSAISDGYLARLLAADGYSNHLPSVLSLAQDLSSADELMKLLNNQQKACCKGVVFLWYAAELLPWASANSNVMDKNRQNASEEEYYSGLIWKAIRAHPLGLSGGYYGYWKYEPEN